MKYVWMIILGIAWIWWTAEVIKDVWYCYKNFNHPFECLEPYSEWWLAIHGLLVFGISLTLWLIDA